MRDARFRTNHPPPLLAMPHRAHFIPQTHSTPLPHSPQPQSLFLLFHPWTLLHPVGKTPFMSEISVLHTPRRVAEPPLITWTLVTKNEQTSPCFLSSLAGDGCCCGWSHIVDPFLARVGRPDQVFKRRVSWWPTSLSSSTVHVTWVCSWALSIEPKVKWVFLLHIYTSSCSTLLLSPP